MKIYLDLLPKQRKTEIRRKRIFRRILRQEFLFALPIFLFIAILANIYYLISVQRKVTITANTNFASQDKYQELHSYEEKFKQVNETMALLLKIQANHFHWADVLGRISSTVPEGIYIGEFSTKNYKILLVGKSKNRDILLNFKNDLESDSCFENVNVPLSNLVVKDNIDFQIDFSVKRDCLLSGK